MVTSQRGELPSPIHRAKALLIEEGFSLVREWIHLEIATDAQLPSPEWPDGITVRVMNQNKDWSKVGAAMDEAFNDHWGMIPAVTVLEPDESEQASDDTQEEEDDPYSNSCDFCFVAMHGSEVVGSCLGNAKTIEWPDSGKVGSLSVRRAYRRLGIGRASMLHALNTFRRHGTRRVITDTDAQSFTGANLLYQQIGMQIYRREHLYEKEIRPGRELWNLAPPGALQ